MNQFVPFPSEIVKCKKCGSRYIYEPGSCTYPFPRLVPLSIKGWIATFKNFFKRDKNGIITKICPICGGEIEEPRYLKSLIQNKIQGGKP